MGRAGNRERYASARYIGRIAPIFKDFRGLEGVEAANWRMRGAALRRQLKKYRRIRPSAGEPNPAEFVTRA